MQNELKYVEFDALPTEGEVRDCGLGKDIITNVRTIKRKDAMTGEERDVFVADVLRFDSKSEYENYERLNALALLL